MNTSEELTGKCEISNSIDYLEGLCDAAKHNGMEAELSLEMFRAAQQLLQILQDSESVDKTTINKAIKLCTKALDLLKNDFMRVKKLITEIREKIEMEILNS